MRKNCAQWVRRFLADETGPTAVEYAVMLVLIVIVCFFAINAIGTTSNKTMASLGDTMTAGGS